MTFHGLNFRVVAALCCGVLACSTSKGGSSETTPQETEGATEGEPTDTGDEPTAGDTDGEPPAACEESDPAVSAEFEVEIDGAASYHEIDLPCTVDEVVTEAGKAITRLTCDEGGTSRAVVLSLPAAPEGDVAWAAGDSVQLASRSEDLDVTSEKELELRGADDALLVAGFWPIPTVNAKVIAPITIGLTMACGPEELQGTPRSFQLDFTLAEQSLTLFSGHRGELVIDAAESFAIDVDTAIYNDCCHWTESFSMLIRRVKTA
ncbi:hypothetical protein [Nannocystis punicea]|uniref:Lipoprotein n=1 Tax=Nannocystis punicea TaxID=2995304 RepID=A0ABY7GZP0_9BACT|nr:hypothetical protein [Nannocystis poenicansa]WAS92457.1 hypothetical protein O0S08_40275 [Nannocystis poenicansa]